MSQDRFRLIIIIATLAFLIVFAWFGSRVATAQERIADAAESAASNQRFEQIDVRKYHSGEFSGIEPRFFDTRIGEAKKSAEQAAPSNR